MPRLQGVEESELFHPRGSQFLICSSLRGIKGNVKKFPNRVKGDIQEIDIDGLPNTDAYYNLNSLDKVKAFLQPCTSRVDVILDPYHTQQWYPYFEGTRKMAPQFRSQGVGYIRLGDDMSQYGVAFISLDAGRSFLDDGIASIVSGQTSFNNSLSSNNSINGAHPTPSGGSGTLSNSMRFGEGGGGTQKSQQVTPQPKPDNVPLPSKGRPSQGRSPLAVSSDRRSSTAEAALGEDKPVYDDHSAAKVFSSYPNVLQASYETDKGGAESVQSKQFLESSGNERSFGSVDTTWNEHFEPSNSAVLGKGRLANRRSLNRLNSGGSGSTESYSPSSSSSSTPYTPVSSCTNAYDVFPTHGSSSQGSRTSGLDLSRAYNEQGLADEYPSETQLLSTSSHQPSSERALVTKPRRSTSSEDDNGRAPLRPSRVVGKPPNPSSYTSPPSSSKPPSGSTIGRTSNGESNIGVNRSTTPQRMGRPSPVGAAPVVSRLVGAVRSCLSLVQTDDPKIKWTERAGALIQLQDLLGQIQGPAGDVIEEVLRALADCLSKNNNPNVLRGSIQCIAVLGSVVYTPAAPRSLSPRAPVTAALSPSQRTTLLETIHLLRSSNKVLVDTSRQCLDQLVAGSASSRGLRLQLLVQAQLASEVLYGPRSKASGSSMNSNVGIPVPSTSAANNEKVVAWLRSLAALEAQDVLLKAKLTYHAARPSSLDPSELLQDSNSQVPQLFLQSLLTKNNPLLYHRDAETRDATLELVALFCVYDVVASLERDQRAEDKEPYAARLREFKNIRRKFSGDKSAAITTAQFQNTSSNGDILEASGIFLRLLTPDILLQLTEVEKSSSRSFFKLLSLVLPLLAAHIDQFFEPVLAKAVVTNSKLSLLQINHDEDPTGISNNSNYLLTPTATSYEDVFSSSPGKRSEQMLSPNGKLNRPSLMRQASDETAEREALGNRFAPVSFLLSGQEGDTRMEGALIDGCTAAPLSPNRGSSRVRRVGNRTRAGPGLGSAGGYPSGNAASDGFDSHRTSTAPLPPSEHLLTSDQSTLLKTDYSMPALPSMASVLSSEDIAASPYKPTVISAFASTDEHDPLAAAPAHASIERRSSLSQSRRLSGMVSHEAGTEPAMSSRRNSTSRSTPQEFEHDFLSATMALSPPHRPPIDTSPRYTDSHAVASSRPSTSSRNPDTALSKTLPLDLARQPADVTGDLSSSSRRLSQAPSSSSLSKTAPFLPSPTPRQQADTSRSTEPTADASLSSSRQHSTKSLATELRSSLSVSSKQGPESTEVLRKRLREAWIGLRGSLVQKPTDARALDTIMDVSALL